MTEQLPSFKERLAKLQAEKGIAPAQEQPVRSVPAPAAPVDADLIPEVYERTEADQLIDDTLRRIDPLAAYKKWINKEIALNEIGQDEVHISCPFPHHRDANPSAWINVQSGFWHCGGCQEGGDLEDLAAIGFGYGSKAPKGADFHRLREAMAESFGTHVKKVAGGQTIAWRDDAPPPASPAPAAPEPSMTIPAAPVLQAVPDIAPAPAPVPVDPDTMADPAPVTGAMGTGTPGMTAAQYFGTQVEQAGVELPEPVPATVTPLHSVSVDYTDDEEVIHYPTLDWRSIVPEDTFLWEYLTAASMDDSPEEYHFWHGMLALSHTVGRRVRLDDEPAVNANLLLCLLGGTGFGKSKSRRYLNEVLEKVVPFKDAGDRTTGVKVVPMPGSGEFLVRTFEHESKDPSTNRPTGQFNSVNGIVDYDEFAGLLARIKRQGSTLQQIIMQFADCSSRVSIGSLTSGIIQAHDPFCSITASTQPRAIRAILNKTDQSSGFLNRWIFAGGPRKEKVVFGGATYGGVSIDMSRSVDKLKLVKGWGGVERFITIEPEAVSEIVAFFKRTIYPAQKRDKTEMLSRMDVIYKKILLLMAINSQSQTVTLDMHRRCAQIIEYLIHCYQLVATNIGITAQHEVSEDILRHMERHMAKHQKGCSARDLSRYMATKNYTPAQLSQALDNLIKLDMIELEPRAPGPGRPTVRYRKVDVG